MVIEHGTWKDKKLDKEQDRGTEGGEEGGTRCRLRQEMEKGKKQ